MHPTTILLWQLTDMTILITLIHQLSRRFLFSFTTAKSTNSVFDGTIFYVHHSTKDLQWGPPHVPVNWYWCFFHNRKESGTWSQPFTEIYGWGHYVSHLIGTEALSVDKDTREWSWPFTENDCGAYHVPVDWHWSSKHESEETGVGRWPFIKTYCRAHPVSQ